MPVALLANMKPSLIHILTPFASRRALLSIVPIPANLPFAGGQVILFHTCVAAVTVDTKAALITASVTGHSRSLPHSFGLCSEKKYSLKVSQSIIGLVKRSLVCFADLYATADLRMTYYITIGSRWISMKLARA
jgi:hypothetical protein